MEATNLGSHVALTSRAAVLGKVLAMKDASATEPPNEFAHKAGPTFCESHVRLKEYDERDIRTVRSRVGLSFQLVSDRRAPTVEITFSPRSLEEPVVINRDVLQEAKVLWMGLLSWVRAASGTDVTPPVEEVLDVVGGEKNARIPSRNFSQVWRIRHARSLNACEGSPHTIFLQRTGIVV